MVIPTRWYAGGKGLKAFREMMLENDSICRLVDFVNGKDCFPESSTGGICYFLIDRDYHGECIITNVSGIHETTSSRYLSDHNVLIRYNVAIPILNKIRALNEDTLDNLVLSRNPFGLNTAFRGQKTSDAAHPLSVLSSTGITFCSEADIKHGHSLELCSVIR